MKEPIPLEALGRARDFIRRAKAECTQCEELFAQLWQPITARVGRHPGRNVRPEHVTTFVREWQTMPCRFRLHLGMTRTKLVRVEVFEIRVSATKLRRDDWPNGEDGESNLAIVNVVVVVGRDGQKYATPISTVVSHVVSLHALARRYQRCTAWDDADVLRDLSCLMQVQPLARPDSVPCTISTEFGEWRGEHVSLEGTTYALAPVVAVRTWISKDQ